MADVVQCPSCQGLGRTPNALTGEPMSCPVCDGAGVTEPPYERLPFWYIIDAIMPAGTGIITGSLTIEPRADFEWVFLSATHVGTFQTEFTDASGRTYQNAPVNDANQWGTAQRLLPLIAPVKLKMRSALNWRLTDTSGALPHTVQLALIGNELYPLKG